MSDYQAVFALLLLALFPRVDDYVLASTESSRVPLKVENPAAFASVALIINKPK